MHLLTCASPASPDQEADQTVENWCAYVYCKMQNENPTRHTFRCHAVS